MLYIPALTNLIIPILTQTPASPWTRHLTLSQHPQVQDFPQAELQHQDDLPQKYYDQDEVQYKDEHQDEVQQHDEDGSGDDLPALVMNVDAVDDKVSFWAACTPCSG